MPRPSLQIASEIATGSRRWGKLYDPTRPAPEEFHQNGDTQSLVDALNELVIREGGRVYLAKDTFTRPEHFRRMEPRLPAFLEVRKRWDPEGKLKSAQSVRLFGDAP